MYGLYLSFLGSLATAIVLSDDSLNGIWVTTSDQDGNRKDPRLLNFTAKFDLVSSNTFERRLTTVQRRRRNDLPAILNQPLENVNLPPRGDNFLMRKKSSDHLKDNHSEDISSTTQPISALKSSGSPTSDLSCGDVFVDDNDATFAEDLLVAYCDYVGIVDAYQHLASKWGNTVVYICARGHPEICSSSDVESTMIYLESQCPDQSGWVYNNLLNPNSGNNKYGKDVLGADFC